MILMRSPLQSPYFSPQVVLARQCVNLCTIIWSAIVIYGADRLLGASSPYRWITVYVHEDIIAGVLGSIALAQFLCIWPLQLKPLKHGAWGYGLLAFCWGFVLFSIYFSSTTLFPTAGATVPIIFGLAFYGFVSIPKVRIHGLA